MRIESARFRKQSVRKVSNRTISVVRDRSERGIALITSLLLLILMSILGLGMVLAVNSDMLINGYYGNYRSAYYAADTGLNVARQALFSQISAQVNMTPCAQWGAGQPAGCTTLPIPNATTAATTALSNVVSSMGTGWQQLNAGNAANSWPAYFEFSNASTFAPASVPTTCGTSGCSYVFQYTVVSLGKGPSLQQVITKETGQMTLQITPVLTGCTSNCTTTTQSFSSFGAFISNFAANSSPLVYGTVTGPQFTNGSWNFGSGGNYTFTDPVGQSGATVSYDFSNYSGYNYVDSASSSASYNGTTIAPNFQQGLQVGLPASPLPTDSFSQEWAVLDGLGSGEGTLTNASLNAHLENINGAAYPTGGATTGVYLPYSGSGSSAVMNGGGFYLEGGANSVTLSAGTDTLGNPTQIYTIVQGSTTTTITTNVGAGTTTVKSGTTTTVISGVPHNSSGNAQTLLYADGTLGNNPSGNTYTGLSGTIQNGVQLTVVAAGDIDISGNLTYLEEPVTLTTADTLVSANATALNGAVLGLYTQSGNLNLVPSSNGGNLEIDAAIAAIGTGCSSNPNSCGLETPGNSVGTLTIVGGRTEGNAHGVSMSGSNTYYDRRFQQPNFAPPWFPTTTVSTTVIPPQPIAPTVKSIYSKLNWSTSPQ